MSSQAENSNDVHDESALTQSQAADDHDAQAQYTDDGMGSPVRQFAPRGGRSRQSKRDPSDAPKVAPKTKSAPKTASKTPAAAPKTATKEDNAAKKRKAVADAAAACGLTTSEPTSGVKVSKRAKTMAAEGAAKAAKGASKGAKKGAKKDAYERVQDAIAQLEEHEALLTSIAEEDVEGFLERTRSADGFEVETIDDEDFPTSPAPAPDRRPTKKKPATATASAPSTSSSQSGRGMSSASVASASAPAKAPEYAAVVPWGPWAIAPRDRAGDGKNESLVEVEKKLKDYYCVPFATWWAAPAGTHTKYTGEKRYGVKPEDADAQDRKVVHAVLEGYSPGEKAGRMCNGWKSEKTPWSRVEYPTVDFFLQKKNLPADWTPPGIALLRALSQQH